MSVENTRDKGAMVSVGSSKGSASGLSLGTLRRYARSELLERDQHGDPIYMHHERCPSFCDFACNGSHGDLIARDIANMGKPNTKFRGAQSTEAPC